MLREPTLRGLLSVGDEAARDALGELPAHVHDDLLTLHEAHAALRHLLCVSAAAPQPGEPAWSELTPLLVMAREAGCDDEAHFCPLEDLSRLRAVLESHQHAVPSLVRLLAFASPQHPLQQRTRGAKGGGHIDFVAQAQAQAGSASSPSTPTAADGAARPRRTAGGATPYVGHG